MQLDKENKFNFFIELQQKKLRATLILGMLSLVSLLIYIIYDDYDFKSYPANREYSNIVYLQKGVLTVQKTSVSTFGLTFVVTPYK